MSKIRETYAIARLKDDTPFNNIFPDKEVPIISIFPIIPREAGCPSCYLVDAKKLNSEQIIALAELLYDSFRDEARDLEQVIEYIRTQNCPLQVSWFNGVLTNFPITNFMVEPEFQARDYDQYILELENHEEDWFDEI